MDKTLADIQRSALPPAAVNADLTAVSFALRLADKVVLRSTLEVADELGFGVLKRHFGRLIKAEWVRGAAGQAMLVEITIQPVYKSDGVLDEETASAEEDLDW